VSKKYLMQYSSKAN